MDLTREETDFLRSLSDSELVKVLQEFPSDEQRSILNTLSKPVFLSERSKDVARKREERSEAARIEIPDVVDPQRRERALADPELFLKTYFPKKYKRRMGAHHHRMIDALVEISTNGGKQSIAAPRGCGKSEIVKGMIPYLIFSGRIRFPVPMAATGVLALRLYLDFRRKMQRNDLLHADFPEVCHPIRALDGAPQRAEKQHVAGVLTEIVWKATDYLCLPIVAGSPFGGVKMSYASLDGAIRGLNIDSDRPDLVILDDPETRESAKHVNQIEDRRELLDRDIAGLAEEGEDIAIVVLTTLQNNYCLSAELTDRKQRPAYAGMRFGMVVSWPDDMEMWNEYMALWQRDNANGDRNRYTALAFYEQNRVAMDKGSELLTDEFKPRFDQDGKSILHSNLQRQFDVIADIKLPAYLSEYQNDPEPEEIAEGNALTIGRVMQCTSKLERGVSPEDPICVTRGIDIGKYKSHWWKAAWHESATGYTLDYGIIETYGLDTRSSERAIDHAIVDSLIQFADADDETPLLTLVDSGNFTNAIYEACNQLGGAFRPAKGYADAQFKQIKPTDNQVPFLESYARKQLDHSMREMWLYHVNTDHWKDWLQERFLTDTFDDHGFRVPGSMAIFEPPHGDIKFHSQLGRHMVSEGWELVPVKNKVNKKTWIVRDKRNNHWLDAGALCSAAAGCVGIRLIQPAVEIQPRQTQAPRKPRRITNRYGQSFVARR